MVTKPENISARMTGHETYRETIRRLEAAGVENPAFDAACLFEKHIGQRPPRAPMGDEAREVPPGLWGDVARRCGGEPLQYILGEWEFMGLPFEVGPGVLIPRPETELLAEAVIEHFRGREGACLLELCAGSGCVAISVAKMTGATACCLELSQDAMRYLRANAALNGLESRVEIVQGDMLGGVPEALAGRQFDAIVCNPPYIPTQEIATLQREVRDHEPTLALDGGEDGLLFYRAFAPWARLLRPGGLAVLEVGMGQAGDVAGLLEAAGLADVFIRPDYAGIDRVVGGYGAVVLTTPHPSKQPK